MAESRKKTTTKQAAEPVEKVEVASVAADTRATSRPIVAKDVDLNQYIPVINGFHGMLIYVSKRTGEEFRWESFGDEQEIELIELRNAKSAAKGFFINNWFMFDDEWVIDYLGVRQYYKNAIRIEDFDNIFLKSPSEIKSIIGEMSEGQKRSAAYRARQLVNEGTIDSRKTISALEEALGIELIER